MTKKTKTLKSTIRTSEGLRDALFDEIDLMREGKSNPQRASAVARLSCQITNTVRLELDYQRQVRAIDAPPKLEEGNSRQPTALKLGAG